MSQTYLNLEQHIHTICEEVLACYKKMKRLESDLQDETSEFTMVLMVKTQLPLTEIQVKMDTILAPSVDLLHQFSDEYEQFLTLMQTDDDTALLESDLEFLNEVWFGDYYDNLQGLDALKRLKREFSEMRMKQFSRTQLVQDF